MKLSMNGSVSVWIMAAAALLSCGCQKEWSDSDIVRVDSHSGLKLVHGKGGLLGMGSGKGVWVDPRTPEDFAKGHIPGAVNIPFEHLQENHKQLNDYKTVVVYGEDYGDWRAKGATKRLLDLGHGEVRMLEGGLRAWTTAGNDVEKGG